MAVSEKASDTLVITLFGPGQVLIEGHPLVSLRSRKALWLLALLTLRHDRPVEREWLTGTLWPDVDQTRAFANLRPVVSELRHALGNQAYRLQSPDRGTLLLNLTGAEVDVCEFDAGIESRQLAALERAVTLYQGPLLEGCTEEWVFQERETREQHCLHALQKLAEAALTAGDSTTAAEYYRRAVRLVPLWEAAHRGLMDALAKSGDRNAALQVYRDFVALLRDIPHAIPDEQTSALYSRLRAQARQPAAPPSAAADPVSPAVTGHVPHALTELVGREEERVEVATCLRRSRLVTLTGVGGIGKTRLAMAVAGDIVREYTDGVWLVALESLSEGQQVMPQIAAVLGIKEAAGFPLLASVTEHLRHKRLLLVLDNCEHLMAASAEASECLLAECTQVRILATSREALGITGEMAWTVPSLPTPDPEHLPERQTTLLRVLMDYDSVQLFVERAQAVQKTFALTGSNAKTVARVCCQLEGIPLAIELAAARVKVITVEQIAARLGNYLGLLTGGSRTVQARQQTLRATLDWSYALLSEPERLLLQRLSVFAGGCTLEAVEGVIGGRWSVVSEEESGNTPPSLLSTNHSTLGLLTSLVDKSLVVFEEPKGDGGGRYRLLEMVRQYAGEQLVASGEEALFMTRHLEWFVALAEEAEPQLRGTDQTKWLRRLQAEYDNLRAIFARSEHGVCAAEDVLRLAGAMWRYWYIRGDYSEGRKYLMQALERGDTQARTAERAKALNGAGALAFRQNDHAVARELFEQSLAIRQDLGDRQGVAETIGNLGNIEFVTGDSAKGHALHLESLNLRRQLDDKPGIALMLANIASKSLNKGDYVQARSQYEESLMIYRELGDRFGTATALNSLGNVAAIQGDLVQAQTLYEESLSSLRELGDKRGIAWTLKRQGNIASMQGDYTLAQALHQEAVSLFRAVGDRSGMAATLQHLGDVAFGQGEIASAHSLYEESLSVFKELRETRYIAWTLHKLGNVAYAQRDDAAGRALYTESLSLFKELGDKPAILMALYEVASVMLVKDVYTTVYLWGAARALGEIIGMERPARDKEDYERQVNQVRSAMEEDAFSTAWEAGYALTWEQVTDYTLELLERENRRE
jgi:predicted ATPase/DNA-binding SARP family transcriptional activator